MLLHETRYISISIQCTPERAYEFISAPQNLPQWASGLSGSIRNINGEWIADAPTGKVKVRFVEKNSFGILDHEVCLETGMSFYNPMRVMRNGNGCEVVFTLFKTADMDTKKFNDDADWITKDLNKLKSILES